MLKRIAAFVAVALLLASLLAVAQIFRYEYFYEGNMRIDKLSGHRQYHCSIDESWKESLDTCQSLLYQSHANPALRATPPPAPCMPHSQYIKESQAKGWLCSGKFEDSRPLCWNDENSNNLMEPWEQAASGAHKVCMQ